MKKLPQIRTRDIVVQNLGKEVLIYDLNRHKAFNLNETAAAVYQACDGRTTFEELKIRNRFTDDLIYLALDQLKKDDLIEAGEAFVSPLAELSRREAIRRVGLASLVALPVISSLVAPTAAQAQSLVEVACATPGGSVCKTADDCAAVGYCNTGVVPNCTCISNCCVECPGVNQISCGGVCVDGTTTANCFGCGNVCPGGFICNTTVQGCTLPPL
jgi:hypothetical protein